MSRHQRRQADPAVTLDLNALAASCNAACGGEALLWNRGCGTFADVDAIAFVVDDLLDAANADKPGQFAQHLGELVFDALGLAGALGIDIAAEVERARKASLSAQVGK